MDTYEAPTSRTLSLTKLPKSEKAAYAGWLRFYCTDGMCTHEEEHLEEGLLTGHVIECPLHQGRFDIRTGEVISPPPFVDLNTYPVKTENGEVYVMV